MRAPLHRGRPAMACQRRARPAGLSGRARPDGSRGAEAVRPASVRQCRARDRDAARGRRISRSTTPAFEAGIVGAEWPARMQRLAAGALVDQAPRGLRDLARRRPQCRGRPRRRRSARRSRGAGVAAAGGDRRHDGEQGCGGVSRQFRRPDPPHHRGADPGPRQRDAAGRSWPTPRARSACASRSRPASRPALQSVARLAYEVPPRILITGSLYLAGMCWPSTAALATRHDGRAARLDMQTAGDPAGRFA